MRRVISSLTITFCQRTYETKFIYDPFPDKLWILIINEVKKIWIIWIRKFEILIDFQVWMGLRCGGRFIVTVGKGPILGVDETWVVSNVVCVPWTRGKYYLV